MPPRARLAFWVLIATLFVLHRSQEFWQPMNRDLGAYAWVGGEINAGKALYRDIFNDKTPGLALYYSLVLRILPQTHAGLQAAYTLVALLALGAFWWLAGRLLPGGARHAALGFFTLYMTLPAWSEGGGLGEGLLVIPVIFAAGMVVGGAGEDPRRLVAAGTLTGVAFWIKQTGASFGIALILWVLARAAGRGVRRTVLDLACLALGLALVVVPWVVHLAFQGTLAEAYQQAFRFGIGHYRGIRSLHELDMVGNLLAPLSLGASLLVGALLGMGTDGRMRREDRLLVVFWFLTDAATVQAQGHYYPHQFLRFVPAASLLAGGGLVACWRRGGAVPRVISITLLAMLIPVCYGTAGRALDVYRERVTEGLTDTTEIAARFLGEQTRAGDPVLVWGMRPTIYFLSGRRNPTAFFAPFLLLGPDDRSIRWYLRDLEAHPPALIIDTIPGEEEDYLEYIPLRPEDEPRMPPQGSGTRERLRPIVTWIRGHYRLAGNIHGWPFFVPVVAAGSGRQ